MHSQSAFTQSAEPASNTLMKNKLKLTDGVTITATISPATEEILFPEVIKLIAALHRNLNQRRKELLTRREQRQVDLDAGKMPDFLPGTENVRQAIGP
jgi:malate synthase